MVVQLKFDVFSKIRRRRRRRRRNGFVVVLVDSFAHVPWLLLSMPAKS